MKKENDNYKFRRVPQFLAMAGIVVMLAGCGQEEAVSVDAQTQVTSGAAGGDSALADDATGDDSMTAQPVDSQKDTVKKQRNSAEEQIEMDEETRQQLTAELLEENDLDTAVMETGRTKRGCFFDLPEGFEKSREVEGLYVSERYPLDVSMIYYEVLEKDTSMQLMTEELFREQAEENLRLAYDEDIEVEIDSFESIKIDDYPAFRILCHYRVDGIEITQLEYVINADKSYTVTYSQTSDNDWMEAYEASAATIRVK